MTGSWQRKSMAVVDVNCGVEKIFGYWSHCLLIFLVSSLSCYACKPTLSQTDEGFSMKLNGKMPMHILYM